MPYVMENLVQYDLTDEDVAKLGAMGFITQEADETPGFPAQWETTALVWDELGIEGDLAFLLFDAVLGKL